MHGAASEPSSRRLTAGVYALLLFSVVVWGGSFVAARLLLNPDSPGETALSPIVLATLRFSLAAVIFLPILLRETGRGEPARGRDWLALFLIGQLAISTYFWLQYTGVQLTGAGVSAILVVGLIPSATAVMAALLLGEMFGPRRWLGLALGGLGVVVVVGQRGWQVAVESGFLLGALCLVANAVCFALYSVLSRRFMRRFSSLFTTAGMTCAGAVGLLAMGAVSGGWENVALLSGRQWMAVLYLVIACSVMAYFFYNFALTKIEAGKVAVWIYLEPIVAVGAGAALLGETVSMLTIMGSGLIAAGVYYTVRS